MCVRTHRHLDIGALSVPVRGRGGGKEEEKKLQHISGIFQLMMCGCGSTGEREPLTVLSLFRSPRAPCCIPVHCAYFGNSCTARFFLFYCIQFVCCSCTFLTDSCSPLSPSLPLSSPFWISSASPSLFPFLALWSSIVMTVNCPFCRTRERKRASEGGVK